MLTVAQIKEALKDRRLAIVAEATGLTRVSLNNIRNGTTKNPSYNTVVALSEYLTKGFDQ